MKISFISLNNIRCFKGEHTIHVSDKINLFVGPNNSGKTTLLRAVYGLQSSEIPMSSFVIDNDNYIRLGLLPDNELYNIPTQDNYYYDHGGMFHINQFPELYWEGSTIGQFLKKEIDYRIRAPNDYENNFNAWRFTKFSNSEPNNLIYPIFSKRKPGGYDENISAASINIVDGTLKNLYGKVDRLINPKKSFYRHFVDACNDILGFEVSSEASHNGKITTLYIDDNTSIPLTSMGEGVANMLGIIADLCLAKDKIFIIEEPENDIHPKALKALLKLIEVKTDTNQFFISTHSNIVVKYLGSNTDTRIFQVVPDVDDSQKIVIPPQSHINEVGKKGEERRRLLEDLGYDLFDYEMWNAWLFLEESSAEIIIRDLLIPNFTKLQGKLVTHSARGIDQVESSFEDFNRLFVYIYQDQIYTNRAWVVIDSGENKEKEIISRMKEYYLKHGWKDSQFRQFSKHDFEEYYPSRFSEKVKTIYSIDNSTLSNKEKKSQKRLLKKELLDEVKGWYMAYPDAAIAEFGESAKEVIQLLQEIESALEK